MKMTKGLQPIRTGIYDKKIMFTFYAKSGKTVLIGLSFNNFGKIKDKDEYFCNIIKQTDNNFFSNYDIKQIHVANCDRKIVIVETKDAEVEVAKVKPKVVFGRSKT